MVVQIVPEGVDEVDGVVSSIGIGVTWEQHCKCKAPYQVKIKICSQQRCEVDA